MSRLESNQRSCTKARAVSTRLFCSIFSSFCLGVLHSQGGGNFRNALYQRHLQRNPRLHFMSELSSGVYVPIRCSREPSEMFTWSLLHWWRCRMYLVFARHLQLCTRCHGMLCLLRWLVQRKCNTNNSPNIIVDPRRPE